MEKPVGGGLGVGARVWNRRAGSRLQLGPG